MTGAEIENDVRRDAVVRVLGSPVVASTLTRLSGEHLRILAYHGVPDGDAFIDHLLMLREHFVVVRPEQVADAVDGSRPLPRNAVWITFDDARPSVVREALPALEAAGVHATMFVCPGLVESGDPYWFDLVIGASQRPEGLEFGGTVRRDRAVVSEFKAIPDARRRELVAEIDPGSVAGLPGQLTRAQFDRWRAADMSVGNHTFDHPCLDQCSPEQQTQQIADAHELLSEWVGGHPEWFAYPNGDWTPEAEQALASLGYRAAALFDHHLARPSANVRYRLSRLRIDSWVGAERFRAILSGGHSGLFGLTSRWSRTS